MTEMKCFYCVNNDHDDVKFYVSLEDMKNKSLFEVILTISE